MMHTADPKTVLIVEDDPDTSNFYVDLLSLEHYQTIVASSGRAGLAQLAAQRVDVVLLDRRLPDMDGLNVSRQIRASIDASVPIILLTAEHLPSLEAAARDAGITACFNKPFAPEALLERLAELTVRAAGRAS